MRLRDPLPILCQNPEIYDRSKVSADCFDALHSLRMLREVEWIREAAEQSLFPEAAQLVQVPKNSLAGLVFYTVGEIYNYRLNGRRYIYTASGKR